MTAANATVRRAARSPQIVVERLFNLLLAGDRTAARDVLEESLAGGTSPESLANDVLWPIHETLHTLRRRDQVTAVAFNYATRLLRALADQLQLRYQAAPSRGEHVLLFCGSDELEDLGGQLAADLLEAAGYTVRFGGGGIAADDILGEVHERRPAWLVLFSSSAQDAPRIRQVIDSIRSIGGHPNLRIVVGGGVFNRAPGLAEEIGAAFSAKDPAGLRALLLNPGTAAPRTATQPAVRLAARAA